MQKELKEIILQDGKKTCRITTPDERFYKKEIINSITGLPEIVWIPSNTWICSYYPKGVQYFKWLAEHGWNEAEAIKKEAGTKGDKVHQATEDVDKGQEIPVDAKYLNKEKNEMEELNFDELLAIQSYIQWVDEVKPERLANEMTVFGEDGILPHGWAGTLDRVFRIEGEIWIVDLKTSNSIWPSYELQISAYSHGIIDYQKLGITEQEWQARKLAILQLGYNRNKNNYKFTEIGDKYDLFLGACKVFLNENSNAKPLQKDFPLLLQSQWVKSQLEKENKKVIDTIKQGKKRIAKK